LTGRHVAGIFQGFRSDFLHLGVSMELTAGVTTDLSGAEITIRCLQEEGVEFIFGYPGGAVLPLYDELFKQE